MQPGQPVPLSVADLAALGQLFTEHQPRLLAVVQRRLDPALRGRIAPEDVIQEAFERAQRGWYQFRQRRDVTPYVWLYGLVRDGLFEAWRREHRDCRDPKREMPWPDQSSVQLGLSLVHPGTSPSDAAAREEVQRQMRQTPELLKPEDKEILWMRHYDDLTFGDIAAVLGVTENAATVRYVRALRRLKDLWLKLHPGPEGQL